MLLFLLGVAFTTFGLGNAAIFIEAPVRFEAENGILNGGTKVSTAIAGYSGTGYVTGFTGHNGSVSIPFNAPTAGLYEITVGYHAGFADKGFDYQVNNDQPGSGTFKKTGSTWGQVSAGKFILPAGTSHLDVHNGWGWFEVDYIDVASASVQPPKPPPETLSDVNATDATRNLMLYLVEIFGHKVLTGTQTIKAAHEIHAVANKWPALVEGGLMNYSPSRVARGARPKETIEEMVNYTLTTGNGHSILALCWHWNSPCDLKDTPQHPDSKHPWWSGFYTADTNYNLSYALENKSSTQYNLLLSDLDSIAIQLAKLAHANIPVLWRPLHESWGGWFWWGACGASSFKQLWEIMYTRYTQMHQLHNLIWVYTASPSHPDWYPGDHMVDVVGMDIYTAAESSNDGQWEAIKAQFEGKKLIALSETGSIVVPEFLKEFQTMWSWFNTWDINKITSDDIKAVYNDPEGIILDLSEVPNWKGNSRSKIRP